MDFENLHQILRSLYDEMMPLCEDMAGVAKGIAGLGALFYVLYIPRSIYIPAIVTMSEGYQPSSSSCLSNSSLDTR